MKQGKFGKDYYYIFFSLVLKTGKLSLTYIIWLIRHWYFQLNLKSSISSTFCGIIELALTLIKSNKWSGRLSKCVQVITPYSSWWQIIFQSDKLECFSTFFMSRHSLWRKKFCKADPWRTSWCQYNETFFSSSMTVG